MSLSDPAVITCAISGAIANRDQCPAIPYTPAEYAAEARRIVDEGGVHIHIHARRPDGAPSHEAEDYRAIREAIVAEIGDRAIINFSTGTLGVSVEKRVAYLSACRPEVAALNMGSLTYAKYSRSRRGFVFDFVFANPFAEIVALLEAMRDLSIKPEHECFDLGHVGSLAPLIDMGLLQAPVHADFVMGVLGGVPATARNLAAMADNLTEAWSRGEPVRSGRAPPLGCDRDRPRAVAHGRRRTVARWVGAGRPGGQLLPPARRDGAVQRRARRSGSRARRGRRPPAGDG